MLVLVGDGTAGDITDGATIGAGTIGDITIRFTTHPIMVVFMVDGLTILGMATTMVTLTDLVDIMATTITVTTETVIITEEA